MRRPPVRWWWFAILAVVVAGVVAAVLVVRARTPEPSTEAFCARLAEARDLDLGLASLDPDVMAGQLGALQAAARVAPAEVRADVDAVVGLAGELVAVVEANPADPAGAVTEALRQREDRIQSTEDAARRVVAYAEASCGLQLGVSGSPPASG